MQLTDFTPTELSRPFRRHSIVSMVDSLDRQAALIKACDAVAIEHFEKVCRELLYRGTKLTPQDVIDGDSGLRLLHPDEAVTKELDAMCIELEVINDDRGIGWQVTHPFSGIVGTLFMRSPAAGCNNAN